jgi:hypothetical protein
MIRYHHHSSRRRISRQGSSTVAVLGFIAITSLLFSAVLTRSMDTYRQMNHVASWQESMLAAEAGAELGMGELRRTIYDPTHAFASWSNLGPDGLPLPNNGKRFVCPRLVHGGEGNSDLDATVTIDAPPELIDGSERQWYRVRSVGTTYLPGVARITADKRDHQLRRLSFRMNPKTREVVSKPQASRVVELIAKPTSFESAIVSDEPLMINNYKVVIDSYDSRYPDRSTNGLYDPAKAVANGDVATNSQLIDAGNAIIRGDAYTNNGQILNGGNITGEQRDDFYLELTPIPVPTWTSYTTVNSTGSRTLLCGTKSNPARYKMNNMSITGTEILTFAPGTPTGESYAEVWVTGDFKAAGSGSIVVQPRANVQIFLEGNIDVKGNGSFNANSQPARLQILCVQPPPGQTRSMAFGGNGIMVAAIYGPQCDVVFGATGSAGTMWGSLTGKSISMGGTTYIHYDEALADTGYITDYKVRSWFEDSK